MSSSSTDASAPEAATPPTRRLPKFVTSFGVQVIAGLVLGIAAGFIAAAIGTPAHGGADAENGLTKTLDLIGSNYVALLKTAVIPLVATAIIASIANLRKVSNAARLAGQTLIWFAITAFIAVSIGIILGVTIRPGLHAGAGLHGSSQYAAQGGWLNFLQGLIPQNFLGATVNTYNGQASFGFNVLQLIVVSAAVGIAALKVGQKAEPFLTFTQSLLEIVQKVLWWIIRLAPIGTFGLIGHAIATYGNSTILSLVWFIVSVYVGLVLVLFVVYPILVKSHGLSIKQYYSGVWPAVQLGFVSRSSIGTLPLTQRIAERNFGVPRAYASFAVPFGATTKMDGCAAVYPAVSASFVAQFYGIHLTPVQYLLIILVSVVGSAATAGTTGAVVMLSLTLTTVGLPLDGVGLLLAVDPILDMGRTAINVAGQALVPTIVAKREKILDLDLYNAPRTGVPFNDESVTDAEGGSGASGSGAAEPELEPAG